MSSLVIYVVHSAIIHAKTIAPPHLKSVLETYHHFNFVGHITKAWCGFKISIFAHKFSNSFKYPNLHSNIVSNILETPLACVNNVPNKDCRSVGNPGNILVSNFVA